jgi:hypothetical protein
MWVLLMRRSFLAAGVVLVVAVQGCGVASQPRPASTLRSGSPSANSAPRPASRFGVVFRVRKSGPGQCKGPGLDLHDKNIVVPNSGSRVRQPRFGPPSLSLRDLNSSPTTGRVYVFVLRPDSYVDVAVMQVRRDQNGGSLGLVRWPRDFQRGPRTWASGTYAVLFEAGHGAAVGRGRQIACTGFVAAAAR